MVRFDLSLAQLLLTWDTAESFPQTGGDGISNPFPIRRISPTVEPGISPGTFSEYLKMHLPTQCQCQLFLVPMQHANYQRFCFSDADADCVNVNIINPNHPCPGTLLATFLLI